MGTEAVRNLVREGKSRQLRNVVATGGPDGMQTIEMDFARLVTSGLVTMEMAQSVSAYPTEIQAQVSTLRAQAQAQATQAVWPGGHVRFLVSVPATTCRHRNRPTSAGRSRSS